MFPGASVRAHGRALTTVVASFALAVGFLFPTARAVAGSWINVDTTADSLVVDGRCSLREAILAANAKGNVDTCHGETAAGAISLGAGRYVLSIAGRQEDAAATGDLDVGTSIRLRGAGRGRTVIDANGIDRAIDVLPGSSLRLVHLTVTGGNAEPEPGSGENGGGIQNRGILVMVDIEVAGSMSGRAGGGIYSEGTLSVHASSVHGNTARDGAGGIAATGPTEIRDSRITGNHSIDSPSVSPRRDDPGVAAGVDSRQPMTMIRTLVARNVGSGEWTAGGVSMRGGRIVESTIQANHAGGCGSGGVVMLWGLIERSTISRNTAGGCDGTGGVVAIDSQIVNSTISENVAGNPWSPPSGSLQVGGVLSDVSTIVGSTIVRNLNLAPVGEWTGPGGLFAKRLSPPAFLGNVSAIRDTILAGNRDANGAASDCAGTVTSDGHNLLGSALGCDYQSRASDRVGVKPSLGPLTDNGGPTRTHLPMPGSPAIDAWEVTDVGADGDCPRQDQRGTARPQDGNADGRLACDIGAVEVSRP